MPRIASIPHRWPQAIVLEIAMRLSQYSRTCSVPLESEGDKQI
jgi:hypothetical protein